MSALGTLPDGTELEIDLDRLIGTHALTIANSGGGKSGLVRRLLEVTHGRVQHIVLDIEDEFYTLRERYDYVIAGGDGGDVPATPGNAFNLARAALTHGFSLIVQMNDLGKDAPQFVAAFLNGLMSAPRELWHPVLVVIDEAQRFAPGQGSWTEATEQVKDLLQRGRKRGFTAVLASLRISEIDPGVRGLVNNWMLGRVSQSLDRKTMADQLGFTAKEGRERLVSMADRTFWVFGPALTTDPQLMRVADVDTTPVKSGQAKVATPPPPEALRALLDGLAAPATPEPDPVDDPAWKNAVQSADKAARAADLTPNAALQAEIVRLQAELQAERADRAIEAATGQQQLDALMNVIGRARRELATAFDDEIPSDGDATGSAVGETIRAPLTQQGVATPDKPARAGPSATLQSDSAVRVPDAHSAPVAADIDPADQEVLDRLLWAEMLWGNPNVPRHILAFLLGKHPRTKGLLNRWGKLRTLGLIDYESGGIYLTADGRQHARQPLVRPTAAGARDAVRGVLTVRQNEILDIAMRPDTTRAQIAHELGLHERTKSLLNDLGRLRSLQLVDYLPGGGVRAAHFLGGNPA